MMTMTSGEIVTLVAAIGAALVSAINAIASGWGRKKADADTIITHDKLDSIDHQTNGSLKEIHAKLEVAQERIAALETLLREYAHVETERQLPRDRDQAPSTDRRHHDTRPTYDRRRPR